MNRSPLACRAGSKCSSGLEVSVVITGIFGVLDTLSRRFGVSNTASGFQILSRRFGVLHTEIRGFEYRPSGFHIPNFGVSNTAVRKSASAPRGLGQVVHTVTLLNTDSNLVNTQAIKRHKSQHFGARDKRCP